MEKILDEIKDAEIEKISSCPICHSNELSIISQVFLKKINFLETAYCNACSFLFRKRRPSIEWFYKYWNASDAIKGNTSKNSNEYIDTSPIEKKRYKRHANAAEVIEKEIPIGTILDIGTGTGFGLKAFLDRGWKTTGIEPDKSRAEIAKSIGIEIFTESIEEVDKIQGIGTFDLVLLGHTLEHFHHPVDFILKIKKLVSDDKFLYIEVPDLKNYAEWGDALYWKHMQLFNKFTLNKILIDSGFTPLKWYKPKTNPHGKNHISVLAKKTPCNEEKIVPKPSIDQIKKLYIKGAEKELNKTEFPIKYSIKSMEEETSRGIKPDLSQDGLFQLKKIPEKELMIRNSKGCSTKQNFIFLINKITKNKITDPEFEKTQIYD
jgi:SAM-dependent methyltransferase